MRRATVQLSYNGVKVTEELNPYLIDFTYTDAVSGELDDLSVRVADHERKWLKRWSPDEGDRITASIEVFDWFKEGDRLKLQCGTFHVDGLTFEGAPDIMTIKAASFPVSSEVRQEKHSKAWEKVKLSSIAQEFASRAGLKLMKEVVADPTYERLEQREETDFGFLLELLKQEGIACKVVSGQLVLFDEAKYEQGKPVATFECGKGNILDYSFDWSSANCAYRACELTYEETTSTSAQQSGKTNKVNAVTKVTYTPPGAPKLGPVLRVKEYVTTQAEALRIAKNRLREMNKQANLGSMSVMGDVRIAAGVVVTIKGFGKFDEKYIVDRATHQFGSEGYITRMDIRKVLGW